MLLEFQCLPIRQGIHSVLIFTVAKMLSIKIIVNIVRYESCSFRFVIHLAKMQLKYIDSNFNIFQFVKEFMVS